MEQICDLQGLERSYFDVSLYIVLYYVSDPDQGRKRHLCRESIAPQVSFHDTIQSQVILSLAMLDNVTYFLNFRILSKRSSGIQILGRN